MENDASSPKVILAFLGMPGSGKSEAALYLKEKGYPTIRFGQVAEDGIKALGLPLTPENEQMYREKIRKELGMAAFAIRSEEKLQALLDEHPAVVIDGLYSWEEYTYLLERFPQLRMVYVFTRPDIRYARLSMRTIRPLSKEQAKARDFAEIENLNKSGPIAMADYIVENNADLEEFHENIDVVTREMRMSL